MEKDALIMGVILGLALVVTIVGAISIAGNYMSIDMIPNNMYRCSDSDGDNINEASVTSAEFSDGSMMEFRDRCLDDSQVQEGLCARNKFRTRNHICPDYNMCIDGACVSAGR